VFFEADEACFLGTQEKRAMQKIKQALWDALKASSPRLPCHGWRRAFFAQPFRHEGVAVH